MLICSTRSGEGERWAARPTDELDRDLGACYGLPIDITSKLGGLATVARALERGDMPLATVAAVLMGFPDPPSLAKGSPTSGSLELTAQLFWSGLLKADWDPAKHPRTGEPPNPGEFGPKEGDGELSTESKVGPPTEGGDEPGNSPLKRIARRFVRSVRKMLKVEALTILEVERFVRWTSTIKDDVEAVIAVFEATHPFNGIRMIQKAIETTRASLDPPKTLLELQTPPTQNVLGYEVHHIVEQNDDNIAKSPLEAFIEKFGRNLIDSPSNLVWVPRLKHEYITGFYNSKVERDGPLRRQVVNAGDFETQREAGLEALRRFGVLK
jgi:hypothetical protein